MRTSFSETSRLFTQDLLVQSKGKPRGTRIAKSSRGQEDLGECGRPGLRTRAHDRAQARARFRLASGLPRQELEDKGERAREFTTAFPCTVGYAMARTAVRNARGDADQARPTVTGGWVR
jgi:hypothetical protein